MNFTLKSKIIIPIIISYFAIWISVIAIFKISNDNASNLLKKNMLNEAKEKFNSLVRTDVNMLSSSLDILLTNNEIRELFVKKDRDALYNKAFPIYDNMKKKYGITHWYFIDNEQNAKIFLRIHDAKTFNDDIKRFTYLKSEKSRSYGVGLELGITAYALRVVHPYFDKNNNLIGYMELGEEIDHFNKIMKKESGNEFGLLTLKEYLGKNAWSDFRKKQGIPNNWDNFKDYVIINSTLNDENLFALNYEIKKIPDEGLILNNFKKNGKTFFECVFPFYDAGDRKSGALIVLYDATKLLKSQLRFYLISIFGNLAVILAIILIILLIVKKPFKFLKELSITVNNISETNDLTVKINVNTKDEIELLSNNFNGFIEKLRYIINNLKNINTSGKNLGSNLAVSSEQISSTLHEIAATISSLENSINSHKNEIDKTKSSSMEINNFIIKVNDLIENQAASISESSSSIQQMIASINNIENTVESRKKSSDELAVMTRDGEKNLMNMVSSIEDITKSTEVIFDMIKVINHVAYRIDLLAVNATIESAHAGSYGKGFGVVADQIKKLSESTSANAKEITKTLKNMIGKIKISTVITKETTDKMRMIINGIEEISNSMNEMYFGIKEINVGSKQITDSLSLLISITEDVKSSSKNMTNSINEIDGSMKYLSNQAFENNKGMSEITYGINEISKSATLLSEMGGENSNNLMILEETINKFKTE